ncbi:MAG: DUF421 domain-containing protein [Erysipelotrichaceae bacterium]
MTIIEAIIRSLFTIITLQLLGKLLGSRQISQLSIYEYIIGITVGSVAATMAIDETIPLQIPLIAMIIMVVFTYTIEKLTSKSIILRKLLTGKPVLIIYEGKIIEANLKKNNYDINDLLTQARTAGYFDLSQINYAIMETNGQISFLLKSKYRPSSCNDFKYHPPTDYLQANIIIDGNIMIDALKAIHKDKIWLDRYLKDHHINDINDIILATTDINGKLNIYLKNIQISNEDIFI